MTATDADGSAGGERRFPDDFVWGTATAAYQVEGAVTEDGRGPSVWDTFSHTPGKVRRGDTGDIACDFYHRHQDDLDLLQELGMSAFRFSISWSRVLPDGRGAVNQAGLDFYRRLVEGLAARDITPAATLFHWDLPQALEDAGGWPNRDTAQHFAEFAQIMADSIGDLCDMWITHNEPQVVVHQGHRVGTHAPGHTDDAAAAVTTHHLLLGHGLALERLRSALPAARVGITLNLGVVYASDALAEEAAVVVDAEQNRIFLDPVLHGSYPAAARPHMLPPESVVRDGDMHLISAAIDFLGVNFYFPHHLMRADPAGPHSDETPAAGRSDVVQYKPAHLPRTAMGWPVKPEGLYDTLMTVSSELAPGTRLYITENGCAAEDYVDPNGVINDVERIDYLCGHLEQAWRAIKDGAPLDGYFHWSLLDNFEWAFGYQRRFGLVFVDYGNQRRIPKQSARVYEQIARTNMLPASGPSADPATSG